MQDESPLQTAHTASQQPCSQGSGVGRRHDHGWPANHPLGKQSIKVVEVASMKETLPCEHCRCWGRQTEEGGTH